MSYEFRRLDGSHNGELLALAAAVQTGGDSFRVLRDPDFFALSRDFGEASYWGAFAGGRLVGCVGLTRQKRFLGASARDAYYQHDLRVHPAHRNWTVLHGLLCRIYDDNPAPWLFTTILDGNENSPKFARAMQRFLGARPIGRTVHAGVPLFVPWRRAASRVVGLDPDRAWAAYVSLARTMDFAPADEARFRKPDGVFLGLRAAGRIAAVCKLVDQSASRRIVAVRSAGPASRLLSLLCRLRGRAALPRPGQALRHAYLAYCAGEPGLGYRAEFLAYLSRSREHDFSYAFLGLPEREAAFRRGPLTVALCSTTYACGRIPDGLAFSFHELTLV
ncbi:MAG: hypothetical protein AB1452_06735 [Pseudomonadota bacterium]